MTTSPAGWYPDPFARYEHRFWDGEQWTGHVASDGRQMDDPPRQTPGVIAAAQAHPAGWYRDPSGRPEHRYWDGSRWTDHVSSHEEQGGNPHSANTPSSRPNKKVIRQASKVTTSKGRVGGGTLLTEPVLIVNQKVKAFGLNMGYAVYDQYGHQLGRIEELRGFKARANEAYRGRSDDTRAYEFRIVDMTGQVLLTMTRPEKWFSGKSKMVIEDPVGVTIGYITQETYGIVGGMATTAHAALTNVAGIAGMGLGIVAGNHVGKAAGAAAGKAAGWAAGQTARWVAGSTTGAVLSSSGAASLIGSTANGLDRVGHVRFGLETGGERLGSIHAESAAEWDFRVQDTNGAEFARITKAWAGWTKERFTRADNYVVQIHAPLEDPLRSLVVAAALAVDVALKQGAPTTDTRRNRRYR